MTASTNDWTEYVREALILQGLILSDAQRVAVTQQFTLLAGMADLLKTEPLPVGSEPAPVFRL